MTPGPYVAVEMDVGGQDRTGQVLEPGRAVTCFINVQNVVLLQSDSAVIMKNNDSSTGVNIRLVFDNCSQWSYISQCLKSMLSWPTVGTDQPIIKTFGSQTEKTYSLRFCQCLHFEKRRGHLYLFECIYYTFHLLPP